MTLNYSVVLLAQRRRIYFVVVLRFLFCNGRIAVRWHCEAGFALSALADEESGAGEDGTTDKRHCDCVVQPSVVV